MDQPNHGVYNPTKMLSGDVGFERKQEAEDRPRVLQKKRSYAGLHDIDPSRVKTSPADQDANRRGSVGTGEISKVRKGSLRYAVRRIFGRKSKEPEPQLSQTSPTRHGYHQSETTGLIARNELSPSRSRDDELVQRTRSTPITAIATGDIQRTRSPYAMQFPHSARLKPLDLGNPFAASDEQPLRRRKTLPSVQIAELDATTLSASPDSPSKLRTGDGGKGRNELTLERGDSSRRRKREKRRSRSAGDLRQNQGETYGPPQKTSEEMRRWRESWHGSVLRVSGFTTNSPLAAAIRARDDDDRTPMPRSDDPFDSTRPMITPSFNPEPTARGVGSASAFDTADFASELEDRVAKLEQGLLSFRGQLAQLSADRNRRTVLIGGIPSRPRASSGGRTASLLATDLQQDIGPSTYRYDYSQSARPTTSPTAPRTPTQTDPSTVTPSFSFNDPGVGDPFVSPPRSTTVSTENDRTVNTTQPQQYTFKSLYEMLADERSARRRLEMQLKSLRTDIANLHHQVSQQSNVHSQRSSYYAAMDPMVGSSRLHALLRDTEASRPNTSQSPQHQQEAEQQGLVSRFSGSESETVGAEETDEMQTPYDAYQTPVEEQGRFLFDEQRRGTGGMF